jgi:hypothetical protein
VSFRLPQLCGQGLEGTEGLWQEGDSGYKKSRCEEQPRSCVPGADEGRVQVVGRASLGAFRHAH